jgi:hypothetical protein
MGDEILIIHDTKLKSYPDWPEWNIPLFADLKRKQGRHRWYGDQDHSRWVYEDVINDVFFKVWNHTYVRKNNLLDAYRCGFYEGLIPAFRGVIKQTNVCRGYVMNRCEKPENQEELFQDILEKIKESTKETGLFSYDLHKGNVWIYEEKPCLIDLEGVYPLKEYERLKKEHEDLEIGNGDSFVTNKEYDMFIQNLLKP